MHYGLTEASRSTFLSLKKKISFIGKPSPNIKIKILDDNSKSFDDSDAGEILIKGDTVMKVI